MPAAVGHLWDWFCELNAARGGTGFGPAPVGHVEIEAWARLTGRGPSPWEVAALRGLDLIALEIAAEAVAARGPSKVATPRRVLRD
ncbi:MAG: hypothetical protein HQL39_19265 [Alphaproteobacteria bacterium]|nr:hypothetical protein [Alphaproteobacteria bacterium]